MGRVFMEVDQHRHPATNPATNPASNPAANPASNNSRSNNNFNDPTTDPITNHSATDDLGANARVCVARSLQRRRILHQRARLRPVWVLLRLQ